MSGGKYLYLLLAFCLLGMLYPALLAGPTGELAWRLAFWLVLVGVVYAGCREHRLRVLGGILAALAIGLDGLTLAVAGLEVVSSFVVLLFLGFAMVVVLGDVLRGERVTADKLYGATCVYLLIGLTWAVLFQVVDLMAGESGAFAVIVPDGAEPLEGTALMLYHSFVTLSTLGVGDVVATTAYGRMFTSLEAIVGQLYLIILVARLVGMHIYYTTKGKQ
jgi:hypothetical protein